MHGTARTRRHPRQRRRPNHEPGQLHPHHRDQSGSAAERGRQQQHDGNHHHGELHEARIAGSDLHREWIDLELPLSLMRTMHMRTAKSQRGFSLLELMVASSIGLLVILAMTSLFKTGMDTTFTVTQRAETQQNMRSAVELMTKDISLAGAGLPSGGLQLVTGGARSNFACNQTGTCYVPVNTYPNSAAGTPNYMYGILPGFNNGVQNGVAIPNAPGQINSSLTSIYCDYNFPLSNFKFTFPTTTSASVAVVNAGVQPNNILAPGGLNLGDLILFILR